MGSNAISLKPVQELPGMNFFIPDYQRGYRWEKQQAIDLLEDIYTIALKTSLKRFWKKQETSKRLLVKC